MVANSHSRTSSRDDNVTMSPIHENMMLQVPNANCSTLDCPHCDFKCDSSTTMTQHSWEQHPLLMRRKKHLITTARQEASDEVANCSVAMHNKIGAVLVPKNQEIENHHQSENGKTSNDVTTQGMSLPETLMDYREKAMRSISLLSTAAAILESQSVLTQERHQPEPKMQNDESAISASSYQMDTVQPFMAPLYRAYAPSAPRYLTIPLNMIPLSHPSAHNQLAQYLAAQQHRNAIAPKMAERAPPYSCYHPSKPQMKTSKPQSPSNPPAEEIRNLLTSSNSPTTEKEQTPNKAKPRKITKTQRSKQTAQSNAQTACPLGEDRRKQLEDALLSLDYCDINDSSTTMPFKCSDGVWRMVKFKCIKGLWLVQTPDSATPTVYVPCDDDQVQPKALGNACRKRKQSEEVDFDVDSKRLCASAPVLTNIGSDEARSPQLKRTLSNPFMTRQLPAPSQYFTSNEGKRVNISVVKRSTTSSSSDLIKSLLLRKQSPTIVSSPNGSPSSADDQTPCRTGSKTTGIATTLSKTLLKSSMVY